MTTMQQKDLTSFSDGTQLQLYQHHQKGERLLNSEKSHSFHTVLKMATKYVAPLWHNQVLGHFEFLYLGNYLLHIKIIIRLV